MFKHTFDKTVTVGLDYGKFNHDEWQAYRSSMSTIGGSEVGAVLGLDKYTSPQELFYRKLGLYQKTFEYRLAMAMGTFFEPHIMQLVRCHDYDEATFAQNLDKKIYVHQVKAFKKTLFSSELPGYHLNVDGLVKLKGERKAGLIEIKYMSQFTLDMWKDNLPPQYFAQAVMGAGILKLPYSVLAIQNGSHSLALYVIKDIKTIYENWHPRLIEFAERVDKARAKIAKLKEEHEDEFTDADVYAVASEFEPPLLPEHSLPYLEFMSDRAIELEEENVAEASSDDVKAAQLYQTIRDKKKALEQDEAYIKSLFIKKMTEAKVTKVDLADLGSVTYRKSLRMNIK